MAYHPIVRELLRQQEQGYLQSVKGKVDENTSFEVRLHEKQEGLGELVVSLHNLSTEGLSSPVGFKDIAKNLLLNCYGYERGERGWGEFREKRQQEACELENRLAEHWCTSGSDLIVNVGSTTVYICAEHMDTITGVTIKLPIKSLDTVATSELNQVLDYLLLFQNNRRDVASMQK